MKKLLVLGFSGLACLLPACQPGKPAGNNAPPGNVEASGNVETPASNSGKSEATPEPDVLRNPVPAKFKSMTPPDLQEAALIAQGKKLYEDPAKGNCFNCHGEKGKGDGWLATEYYDPVVADLSKPAFQDAVTDQYIFWRLKEPLTSKAYHNSGMLGFPSGTNEEIWALVAYVRSLRSE